MALIEIKNLSKTYATKHIEVKAIKDISLSIEKKEFTAIIGPSGSGKTTLLNMLGGLDKPTAGTISINNNEIGQFSAKEMVQFRLQNIGFVFQAYNLIPVFTALENVEFIMLLQNIPKAERQDRAATLLKEVGLGERLNSRPAQLSGGQQQRVAVARALASHPAYVLADEPTANLDSATADALLDMMEEMNEKYDMTFIFSTHDAKVIKRARRVITLVDGQISSGQ